MVHKLQIMYLLISTPNARRECRAALGALQEEESDGTWRGEGTKAADGARMAMAQMLEWVSKGEGGMLGVWVRTVKTQTADYKNHKLLLLCCKTNTLGSRCRYTLTDVIVCMSNNASTWSCQSMVSQSGKLMTLVKLKMMMFLTAPPQCMIQKLRGPTAEIVPSLLWLQEQGCTYHR